MHEPHGITPRHEEDFYALEKQYQALEDYTRSLEQRILEQGDQIQKYKILHEESFTTHSLLVEMVTLGFISPFQLLRRLNVGSFITLFRALRVEKPSDILRNYRKFLGFDVDASNEVTAIASKQAFSDVARINLHKRLHKKQKLSFETVHDPQVSIILVLYNKAELTHACFQSIAEQVENSLEIIIVDNASTDETTKLLDLIEGVRIIRNKENIGFLHACNQGARLARGKHLLFLNNDAQLCEGALNAAVDTLEANDGIGAVGGRIVLLDGTLQEAGSIIWQDGSCLGYGRGEAPESPEFMFKRAVDYCSGVFLLTPRKTFEALNGFDPIFEPAYYEETDYCLRLWQAGMEVIYDPNAKVIHYEFGSSESSEQALLLQTEHKVLFQKKNAKALADQLEPKTQNIMDARFARQRAPISKILFIEDKIPHIDEGAGFPRSNQIIHHLSESGYFVSVLPFNFPDKDDWQSAYRDLPNEVEMLIGHGRNNFKEFLGSRPNYYDFIWISRVHNFEYFIQELETIEHYISASKIIYDSEAIFANRDIEFANIKKDQKALQEARKQLKDELQLAAKADLIVAVNQNEAEQFKSIVSIPVHVLSCMFDYTPLTTPFAKRSGLLFVGNLDHDDSPNVDSIEWLVEEVYPHLIKEMRPPNLILVGSNKSPKIRALSKRNSYIKLMGRVQDLSPYFAQCRLFVAPTRFAAGSPLKVLQAVAYGMPVVCTDLLRKQLGWDKSTLLSSPASDPKAFAANLFKVLHDEETARDLVLASTTELRSSHSLAKQKMVIARILQ